ncbi:hypothetical protein NP493_1143g00006 [Ridgeia piscesae]|uniref:Uncharacterized protein n=1 Tax=Ridgeia piscesae TaxID=27915 RepID=A0AAD9KHP7_RIDPI|nr:hypothetical protein NP493_1143g00006 [Ridgeia piscesae]
MDLQCSTLGIFRDRERAAVDQLCLLRKEESLDPNMTKTRAANGELKLITTRVSYANRYCEGVEMRMTKETNGIENDDRERIRKDQCDKKDEERRREEEGRLQGKEMEK